MKVAVTGQRMKTVSSPPSPLSLGVGLLVVESSQWEGVWWVFGLLSVDCLQTNKALRPASLFPTLLAGNGAVMVPAIWTGEGLDPIDGVCVCVCDIFNINIYIYKTTITG